MSALAHRRNGDTFRTFYSGRPSMGREYTSLDKARRRIWMSRNNSLGKVGCVLTVMAFIIVLMGGDYFHCMRCHCVITIALSLIQVAFACIGRCVVVHVVPTAVFLSMPVFL